MRPRAWVGSRVPPGVGRGPPALPPDPGGRAAPPRGAPAGPPRRPPGWYPAAARRLAGGARVATGAALGNTQRRHRLPRAAPALGCPGRPPGLRGPRGADRIQRIRLALAVAVPPARAASTTRMPAAARYRARPAP